MSSCKKGCCLLVAALMVLLTASTAFAAANAGGGVYTGQVLAAVNTDVSDSKATFSTDQTGGAYEDDDSVEAAAQAGPAGSDFDFDLPEPMSGVQALAAQAKTGNEVQTDTQYRIGDTRTVYTSRDTEHNGGVQKAELVCTYIGTYCTIWHEIGKEAKNYTDAELAARYDEKIPQLWELYGDKRVDTDQDGKIAVFLYAIEKDCSGYFTSLDLIDARGRIGDIWLTGLPLGNRCDCVHVQDYMDLEYTVSTCTHEYQHYLFLSAGVIGKNNFTFNYSLFLKRHETYILEGFSTSSEFHLCGRTDRVGMFANAASPASGFSLLHWDGESENYALTFVFVQYIRTRYAALTGDLDGDVPGVAFYKDFMEMTTSAKKGDSLTLLADLLYPKLRDPEARRRQLLVDFWLAVLCKEPEGVHGFNGEEWAEGIDSQEMIRSLQSGSPSDPIRSGMAGFYWIGTGEKGSTIRVLESSPKLEFAAVGSDYALRYDANGGTLSCEPRLEPLQQTFRIGRPDPYRSGYTFSGWATVPDAQTPQYHTGDMLTPTEDITLYAVWEPVRTVYADREYTVEENKEGLEGFRFVPEADGLYKLALCGETVFSDCTIRQNDETEIYFADFEPDDTRWIGYYFLNAGTAYDLRLYVVRNEEAPACTFTLTRQTEYHTLTFHSNTSDPTIWTQTVVTSYDMYECAYMTLEGDDMFSIFVGWAGSPDAAEAEYTWEDTITLTQDTTLYAVWRAPVPARTDGEETTTATAGEGKAVFCVTPQTSGTYEFETRCYAEGSEEANAIYCPTEIYTDGMLIEFFSTPQYTCVLEAGQTYYFSVWAWTMDRVGMTARKISDESAARLTLQVGAAASFTVHLDGKTSYTIPDFTPTAHDGRRFQYWYDPLTGTQYRSGDTITLCCDRELTAQWSRKPASKERLKYMFVNLVPSLVKTFVQYLRISAKGDLKIG